MCDTVLNPDELGQMKKKMSVNKHDLSKYSAFSPLHLNK